MRIVFDGVNMEITDRFREQAEQKLEKFQRYFDDRATFTVKVQPDHGKVKVELTLKFHRELYRAESSADEALIALDACVNSIEGKLRKHKSKIKRRRQNDPGLQALLTSLPEYEPDPDEEKPALMRRKSFPIEPMTPEEAALQMELIDHDFFLYLDPDSGMVHLLYKRDDGNYGILEPEY